MLNHLVSFSIFLAQGQGPSDSPLLSGPFVLGLVLGIVIGMLAAMVIKLSRNKAEPAPGPSLPKPTEQAVKSAAPSRIRRCPKCNSTYTDESLLYCVSDGTELVAAGGQNSDPNATLLYPQARRTD